MVVIRPAGLARALAVLAVEPDPQAWELLVTAAGLEMSRIARRITGDPSLGDDAVQEALLQIRDGADTFRVRSADPDADAWRWIMRVTSNAALSLLRRQRRQHLRDQQADHLTEPGDDLVPGHAVEQAEQAHQVRSELAELPESTRLAIVLHCVEGLGYERLAVELGLPVGTAKTRVYRGLRLLRERLTKVGCVLSLTALSSLLRELPASAAPIAQAAWPGLLISERMSSLGALGSSTPLATLGAYMSLKVSLGITAALLAVAIPMSIAISRAEEPAPSVVMPPGDQRPALTALEQQLAQPITLDVQEMDLGETIDLVRKLSRVNLNLLPPVHAGQPYPEITLKVTKMPLRHVLEWIAKLGATTVTFGATDIVMGEGSGRAVGMTGITDPAIKDKMETMLMFDWDDTDFADRAQFMEKFVSVKMVMSPQLAPRKVSLHVRDLPLKRVCELMALVGNARVTVQDRAVHFTPLP